MDLGPYRRPEGRFAFHTTDRENIDSIREEGLRQSAPCSTDTEIITNALVSRGYEEPFPFDRSAAVYCHLDPSYVEEVREELHEWFANDEVVVVVDLEKVAAPFYIADVRIACDLLDHHVLPKPSLTTETFDEAVRQYRESIVHPVDTDAVQEQLCKIDGHPELVVDGDVPTEAIVDIQG